MIEQPQTDIPRGFEFVAACPYCKHPNGGRLKEQTRAALNKNGHVRDRVLVNCYSDDGGCDRDFVVQLSAHTVFTVGVFPLLGVDAAADEAARAEAPADLRVWTLVTRAADEPGDPTDSFNAAQLEEMSGRGRRPLYALALEMRDGDKLAFVSVEGLVSYHFACYEPEPEDAFDSFALARREARRRSLQVGPVEIYFDARRFRLYPADPNRIPQPPADFEHVATVEPPVVFRVELDRSPDAGEGKVAAEVLCDDVRGNPDLLNRPDEPDGRPLIFYSDTFDAAHERAAVREAVEWIRREFPKLDFEIQAPFEIDEDEPPADYVTDDRRPEDRD